MPHFTTGTSALRDVDDGVALPSAGAAAGDEARIKVKNRRLRYLDTHPEYFDDSNLELADPLLYDRLIRRFQTPQEREKEGKERGYTGMLEADLVRGEAKLDALKHPDPNSPIAYRRAADGEIVGVEADEDDRARTREEGRERWIDIMSQRFLAGRDVDFEYATVDENDEYDDGGEEDRKHLEKYLEAEHEEYLGDGTPKGETGVQDF